MKMKKKTLTSSPSLPTLPFNLISEILSRLPVKFLLQFRCICKSWNSLISDPKFAKKHLSLSTTHTVHCTSYSHNVHVFLKSYSLDSVLTNITQTQFPTHDTNVLEFPFAFVSAQSRSGKYVSDTINWLLFIGIKKFIASFDLGKECYREVLLPDDSSK
ncbi:F-box/kelch-repeat protein, partial [Trifolium medium]|nr:F-box/kelch-repeat protein [Trifolium medium]